MCRYLILIFLFISCSNDPELVSEFIIQKDLPIEEIEGAEMLHTQNGSLSVKVIATTIQRFEDIRQQLVFSNGVKVIFYNDSGSIKSILEAEDAIVDQASSLMTASNNIILTSSEGKKLETSELIWDEQKNKIYTDKKVIITTEKELIEGSGFESNSDFSEYTISKIYGTFRFESITE